MKPLSSTSPANWQDVDGVAFDVDDTVTSRGKLDPGAYAAMWALHRAGIRLIAVTGRPLRWAALFARQWPVDAAVGENGAGFYRVAGRTVTRGFFDDDHQRAANGKRLEAVAADVAMHFPEIPLADDQRERLCDLAYDIGEHVNIPPARVEELVARIEKHGLRAVVSSVHAHAMPGTWDKAKGVVRAAHDLLGLDIAARPERWVFVGDSGNDAEAFAFFPRSVGVANIHDHFPLPHRPSFVTAAARGEGFAELATMLLAGKSRD